MRAILLLLLPLLVGCPAGEQQQPRGSVKVDEVLGATPAAGFRRADAPIEFEFPKDHAAHPDFAHEWWYFSGHLQSPDGGRFGYQFTLFRIGLSNAPPADDSAWRSRQIYMGHLAISDLSRRVHLSGERFSRAALGLAGSRSQPLSIWLGPWSIRGSEHALFPLVLKAETADLAIDLTLEAGSKPMVLQGDQGLSRKSAGQGQSSYYYSYTRLPTRGEIRIEDRSYAVSGQSWFDREWSSSALGKHQSGWDWFAIQFNDGRELMYYRMRDRSGQQDPFSRGVIVGREGATTQLGPDMVELTPTRFWRSDDGVSYPTDWRLKSTAAELDLIIEAEFDDQEMSHSVRYWEGVVKVSGSHDGLGYLEMSGYADR